MSAYVPIASVSDRHKDEHCLLCLTRLAGTLTAMTTLPQLRTGSCVNKFLYTTKGPTYKRGNKTNLDCKPLIPVLQLLRACQYFHPREDRTERIQNQTSNLVIVITRYLQPTSNSSIKNIQPSPRLSTAKRQVTTLAIERGLPEQRSVQQFGADWDGPTKRCGRI